jgi:hypothetical protein
MGMIIRYGLTSSLARITTGIFKTPPLMLCHFERWLNTRRPPWHEDRGDH